MWAWRMGDWRPHSGHSQCHNAGEHDKRKMTVAMLKSATTTRTHSMVSPPTSTRRQMRVFAFVSLPESLQSFSAI